MSYIDDIKNFQPECEQEEKDKCLIIELMQKYSEKILYRESELFHITSAGIIVNEALDKTLMVHHNIYHSWSWTGGHADGEKDLCAVAVREIKEETGILSVKKILESPISVDILTTGAHEKRGNYISSHLHLNISYLFAADEKETIRIKPDENTGVKWIPISEIKEYVKDKEMKKVYEKIIKKLKKCGN